MRFFFTTLIAASMLFLAGCKDGDLAAILDHIHGGASVAVDPTTGAITPSVSVNIKDANGRILFRAEGGVPVSKYQVRILMAQGAKRIEPVPSNRSIYRAVDECGNARAVSMAAESLDVQVTPSMREQFRNIILFRDRRYVRNSRPVERVIEKVQCSAAYLPIADVVDAPPVFQPPIATTIPEPNVDFPDIAPTAPTSDKKKVSSLETRVSLLEGQMSQLLQMASRIEAKVNK